VQAVGSIYSDDVPMDVDQTEHAGGMRSSSLHSAAASSAAAAASSSAAVAASGSAADARVSGKKKYFVGREQQYRRDNMVIEQPLKHGLVQNWDGVEAVWQYALSQHLRVDARDHPLMLSEPTFQPHADREKMLQLMFERFEAPATFLCKSSVLTAFSAGRSTACVLESGAGHTTVAPVHDGFVVTKGVRRTQVAGQRLDEILEKVITQSESRRITPAVSHTLRFASMYRTVAVLARIAMAQHKITRQTNTLLLVASACVFPCVT
jgi:actin-related protein